MVRSWIEARAGDDFTHLADKLEDQKAFQKLALDMLGHLELTQATPPEPNENQDQEDEEDQDDGTEQPEEAETSADDQQPVEMAGDSAQGDDQGESQEDTDRPDDPADSDVDDEGEDGMLPTRPNRPWTDLPEDFDYQPIPPGSTR
jgi:cobaltochelatase CobT